MLEIGSLVDGKYKILNVVGKGGMSVVYLAMNERANKQWAIKEVRKDGMQDFEVVKQNLIVETDMLKNLNHPHLPSIIDVIDTKESFLIVMDYIEGKALDSVLKEFGAQPQEYVIEWAKQLCDVLGYLHSRKPPIIYRDMKPANVMLKPDGNVTLIDFGTAREFKAAKVEDTTCLGTRGYAAPEQYGGLGQTDARTDIYCLGATLYHLVTGHNPAQHPYVMYPIRQWNPQLSNGLEQIILKCTQGRPEDRYQNCQELLYDLEHYDELDKDFIDEQKKRLKIFISTAATAAVFGLVSLFTGVRANSLTRQSYESNIQTAQVSATVEDKKNALMAAMKLEPGRTDAYEQMIALFGDDDNKLDTEEYDAISSLIHAKKGHHEYIDELKENKEAYASFCYDLGRILFFYYPGTGGKSISTSWFNEVDKYQDNVTEKEKVARAKIYAKIGSYYETLGNSDPSNESTRSAGYNDFFKDLVELNKYGINQLKNKATAITLYCEIASQIGNNANNFLTNADNITADDLKQQLKNIRNRYDQLQGGSKTDQEGFRRLQGIVNKAEENITSASDQLNRERGIDSDEDEFTKKDTKADQGGVKYEFTKPD